LGPNPPERRVSIKDTPGPEIGQQPIPSASKKTTKLDNCTASTDASEKSSTEGESLDSELLDFNRITSLPEQRTQNPELRRSNSDPLSNKHVTVRVAKPLNLNMGGCKSGQILYILNHFIMSMRDHWDAETSVKFSEHMQKLLDYMTANPSIFKTARADSVGVCFILLIGSKCEISKTNFVNCLKIQKLGMAANIPKVKKTKCYLDAKRAYYTIQKMK